jgi:hypothetical protein
MSATYDNSVDTEDFGVTSLTTGSFTIGGTEVAACLGLSTVGVNITLGTAACGGVSATLIPNTNLFAVNEVALYQVIAPPTGSRTATASWTTAASASLSAITANGVDQTTPLDNGATNSSGFGSSPLSQAVTSNPGDLTTTIMVTAEGGGTQTTDKTQRTASFGCSDTGDGTGTQTHTWSYAAGSTEKTSAGANFRAASGAAPASLVINRNAGTRPRAFAPGLAR